MDNGKRSQSHAGPARKPDVVARSIAGEALLIPIRDRLSDMQRVFALGSVAEFIWNRLDGGTSIDDLTGLICAEFDVGHTQARQDVEAFLAELVAEGLVTEEAADRAQ